MVLTLLQSQPISVKKDKTSCYLQTQASDKGSKRSYGSLHLDRSTHLVIFSNEEVTKRNPKTAQHYRDQKAEVKDRRQHPKEHGHVDSRNVQPF